MRELAGSFSWAFLFVNRLNVRFVHRVRPAMEPPCSRDVLAHAGTVARRVLAGTVFDADLMCGWPF